MSRIIHCSVTIEYALTNMLECFAPLTPEEAKDRLLAKLAKGHELLPMRECPGHDPVTGCPGHWERPKLELVP
jgi:hypothetical protein